MKTNRWVQLSVLAVVLVIAVYTVITTMGKSTTPVKIGTQAPTFSLPNLDKETVNLEDFRGKKLVVNFWGTFCPPCVEEMPALQRQADLWADKDVVILGINLSENLVTVRSFLKQHDISFPVILDDKSNTIRKRYQVISYPTTFFVDENGVIRDKFVGGMKEQDIFTRISRLSGE